MAKIDPAKSGSNSTHTRTWVARDAKSGRFVEVKSTINENIAKPNLHAARQPGRFKGVLSVGPEFFEPLSEKDLAELNGG